MAQENNREAQVHVQGSDGLREELAAQDAVIPTCLCGKGVRFWAASLEQGFCSDECYEAKVGKSEAVSAVYVAHGIYESTEDQ